MKKWDTIFPVRVVKSSQESMVFRGMPGDGQEETKDEMPLLRSE